MSVFRFASPDYLYLLVLVGVLILIYIYTSVLARRRLKKFGDKPTVLSLVENRSLLRPAVKFALQMLALILLVFTLARPQFGDKVEVNDKHGIEAVLAIDVSNSMLARDVQPCRLDRAKMLITALLDKMPNDRVAIEVFAGEAYPGLPITSDYVSARQYLTSVTTGMVTLQGTNMAAAIRLADRSFSAHKDVGKAIILITDGENHEQGAVEAAAEAGKNGRTVYVLGVGTPEGATIPSHSGAMRDENGEVVISVLSEENAKAIAEAGGGKFIRVDNSNSANELLLAELSRMQKADFTTRDYSTYDEQFQALAIFVVILLLIEVLMRETKNPLFARFLQSGDRANSKQGGSSKRASMLLMLLVLFTTLASAQSTEWEHMRKGNRHFSVKEYPEADLSYREARLANPNSSRARFNMANTFLSQGNTEEAMKYYAEAAKTEPNKLVKSCAFHNMGYVAQANKDYGKAIDYYKEALRNNPNDEDSRYNLAVCQHMKQNNQEQQPDQQSEEDEKNQDQEKEQQSEKKEEKQEQSKEDGISKDNAEQLLDVAKRSEEQTRIKLEEAQHQQVSRGGKNL